MGVQAGIVGLPNVGKSTLFNALTAAGADAQNYPFCTIDPNLGVVTVPDPRLAALAARVDSKRVVPATVDVVDIAGLVRGASKGEGLGNQFLGHIRNVDAVIQVVRCFEDADVAHVDGGVDPVRDLDTLATELLLADLESAERRRDKYDKQAKGGDKEARLHGDVAARLVELLGAGIPARDGHWDAAEAASVRAAGLLTAKPMLVVCNVDESGGAAQVEAVRAAVGGEVVALCAQVEAELAELDPDDRAVFLEDLGIEEPGLAVLARAIHRLLGLQTFFTANDNAIQAWTVRRGATAPEAAGVVHTDFQRGFIRAEVYQVPDLVDAGSIAALRSAGRLRVEGKEYVVREGDVLEIRFNAT